MINKQELEKFKELVKSVKIAMLCTIHKNHMHSRPMATSQVDDDGNLWFFTNEFSEKAEQIKANPHTIVTYSDPSDNTYVSVRGTIELVNDKAKMEELWSPIIKAWFPDGIDDPKLALLKVTTEEAEYWESSSSKMVTLFSMIKAVVTGEKYDEGEYGKIDL